jgi:hypothetical protein
MIDPIPWTRRSGLRVLVCLNCLVVGASQASALPQVHMPPWPGFLLVQAAKRAEPTVKPREQPGAEQQAQANQPVPLTELNEVLEATRIKLEELFGATEGMAERRTETQLLRQENERLAGQLEQVNGRIAELERSSKRAEARIAELTNASEVAAYRAAGLDEELAGCASRMPISRHFSPAPMARAKSRRQPSRRPGPKCSKLSSVPAQKLSV